MSVLTAVLTIATTILVFAVKTLAQSSPPFDPFVPYVDLLTKEQTLKALENRNFSCEFVLLEASQKCVLEVVDGYFSSIVVTITEGIPNDISFQIEPNSLRMGDLVALWGKPENVTVSALHWPDTSAVVADHQSFFAPVWVVSFTF